MFTLHWFILWSY